jgi:hypothetical protein
MLFDDERDGGGSTASMTDDVSNPTPENAPSRATAGPTTASTTGRRPPRYLSSRELRDLREDPS